MFSDLLDLDIIAKMDDVLIYDKTVHEVLRWLHTKGLAVTPEKCFWKTYKVEFLGSVIGEEGIEMLRDKVEAVFSWRTPSSLMEVQSFLGFATFY